MHYHHVKVEFTKFLTKFLYGKGVSVSHQCEEIILMLFARIKGTEKQSCLQKARAQGLVHLPSE